MFRRLLLKTLCLIMRGVLSLRYRVEIENKEVLKELKRSGKGVLVLPNHSAEIEPFILLTILGLKFDLKPLVIERFYYYPFARFFMNLAGAKPVAEFDKAINDYKLKSAEILFQDVVDDLDKGAHILMYPSSGLKTTSEEKVGGRSLAYQTVQTAKDVEVLLVRIQGLWGSLFSKAYTKETPDFWGIVWRGIKVALKNGIFFIPRRKVTITFALPPKSFPVRGSKLEFNAALESFYNQYKTESGEISRKEPLYQVSYAFWKREVLEGISSRSRNPHYSEMAVPNHIKQDIMYKLSELSGKSVRDIHEHDDLIFDLGIDSLAVADIYTHIDSHYELEKGIEPGDLQTVQDLLAAAMHMKKGGRDGEMKRKELKSSWPSHDEKRKPISAPEGDSLIEAFLRSADRMGGVSACTDGNTGIMTYKRMKQAVCVLANKIKELEGDYIGVMLPSSIGAHIVILAILLAKKVPVPLNWTVGAYFMNHAIDLMEIKHVISSKKLLQKVDNMDLGKILEKLVLVEDLRASLTLKDKIKGALLAKCSADTILRKMPGGQIKEDDVAIVLFTSGTTALPKSVPLTHKNLLANQRSALDAIDLNADDVMMMPLPPFHIFGLNFGLFPILVGVRVVFSPDPLDGSAIAKEILKWRVSINVMAPTFFSHLFRVASISQLKSLRICVSGAEKASQTLIDFIHKLGDVIFLEGYGLTETSPLISVNTVYERARGVGKIASCVKVAIVDPETGLKLGAHKVGEICVTGDSVFNGYYKQDNQNVFVDVEGEKYYKTGDLGWVDEDNYIYLEGRLKLSFKRGGEMINVVAIEGALFTKAKEKGWVAQDITHPPFACVPRENKAGSTKVVLFTEVDISLDQVNSALLEVGFSRLYKVNEVVVIDEIPLLKTGKVCYRKLFDKLSVS